MPEYAIDVFDAGGFGFGLMSAVFGAGMATGSAVLAIRGLPDKTAWILIISSFIWDFGMITFAFSHSLPLTLGVLFIMGVVGMFWVNAILILFQRAAPDHLRGRIMSLYSVSMGLFPIGWAYGGMLSELIGNEWAIIVSALGGTPIVIAAYIMSPALRRS